MNSKTSKYNAYRLSYRLFFSFSDTVSLSIDRLDDINDIMVALLPNSLRTLYQVEVFTQGATIAINSVNDIDIPKLVNRLKTHSSKRLFLQCTDVNGEFRGRSLWERGYLLTTLGSNVSATEGFSLLKSKKVTLVDHTT